MTAKERMEYFINLDKKHKAIVKDKHFYEEELEYELNELDKMDVIAKYEKVELV